MTLPYASPWKRACALIIDIIVGGILGLLFGVPFALLIKPFDESMANGLGFLIWWVYFAGSESSEDQATLGKKVFGLKVTDLNGNRILFGQATGRHFGKLISVLPLLGGFIMAFFTRKRQTLHDIMAKCLVLDTSIVSSPAVHVGNLESVTKAEPPPPEPEPSTARKEFRMSDMQTKTLVAVGVVITAMLLYPPYRIHSTSSQAIIQTGYAWLFALPSRATVDIGTLLAQWVGALIVGAIAFAVAKGKP